MSLRPNFPHQPVLCGIAAVCLTAVPLMAALPVVSNVTPLQRPETKLVDVAYTLADPDSPSVTVSLEISSDGGTNWFVPGTDLSGDFGLVAPGNRSLTWNAAVTWDNKYTPGMRFRVIADERVAPTGYQLIPQSTVEIGEFQPESPYTGASNLRPLHSASISPFFIAHHELSFAKWQAAHSWSLSRGYSYLKPGTGKASTHPVNDISWHDALKWCNAASEMEGLEPCYTVSGAVYRSGNSTPVCDWTKNGYRLPTTDEWEKAGKGGFSRRVFPWGNTASNEQANFITFLKDSPAAVPYDVSTIITPNGLAPGVEFGEKPFTLAVNAYLANGFGLFNVVGNVSEWVWNKRTYTAAPVVDPRTVNPGWTRGSSYDQAIAGGRLSAYVGRSASAAQLGLGFRTARTPAAGGTASAVSTTGLLVDTGGVPVLPGVVGRKDLGPGLTNVFLAANEPAPTGWVTNSETRSLSMNKGDAAGPGTKVAYFEEVNLTGISDQVYFSGNLNIRDLSNGFEATDSLRIELVLDGNTAAPILLTAPYDTDANGTLNGSELCPTPAVNPTTQEFNYRLRAFIPPGTGKVQLIVRGFNDSLNEFMTLDRALFFVDRVDSDGDGIRNGEEVTMNTRIDDPKDVCRLEFFQTTSPQTADRLIFQTRIGSFYRFYVSDDSQEQAPLQTWRDNGDATVVGNDQIFFYTMDRTYPGTRYYRLRVQLADEDWPAVTTP